VAVEPHTSAQALLPVSGTPPPRLGSVSGVGTQGEFGAYNPSISRDGRVIAFSSLSANLVADDTNGVTDVFVTPNPFAP